MTTPTKHTPSPWVYSKASGEILGGNTKLKIAGMICYLNEGESCSANGHVIAAAPDLLEAAEAGARYSDTLKRFQDEGQFGVTVTSDELDRLFMDWHDKTHAAIPKATASGDGAMLDRAVQYGEPISTQGGNAVSKRMPDQEAMMDELNAWLDKHELTADTHWVKPEDFFGDELARYAVRPALVLAFEADLHEVLSAWISGTTERAELHREFNAIVDSHGFDIHRKSEGVIYFTQRIREEGDRQ